MGKIIATPVVDPHVILNSILHQQNLVFVDPTKSDSGEKLST